jgi:hypothetical protein
VTGPAPGRPGEVDRSLRPATAARIYDYFLGGLHHFPADAAAAQAVIAQLPDVPMVARANRDFVGRAIRWLAGAGVRQFLDIGSGIPTEGNVHEIADAAAPDCRVVYVDIDPVAVADSLELLAGNPRATAVGGDLRAPQAILDHPQVAKLLDFTEPVGLILAAVLHFVPDDRQAYAIVADLVAALPHGSHVVISHGAAETFQPSAEGPAEAAEIYRTRTATPAKPRTHAAVERFFTGLRLVDPGVVWVHQWHPDPDRPAPSVLTDDPQRSGAWAGMAGKADTS